MADTLETTAIFDGPGALGGKAVDTYAQFAHLHMTKSTFVAQVVFITLITVILFSVFVALFYFVFAAKVEEQVVTQSATSFVSGIAADLKVFLSPDQADAVAAVLSATKLPDTGAADAAVKASNKKLLKMTAIVMGAVTVGILVVIFGTYFGLKAAVVKRMSGGATKGVHYPDLAHIFRISAFTFCGVIVAEFLFLYAIAAQFKPLDPNAVKKAIVESVIANIKKLKS